MSAITKLCSARQVHSAWVWLVVACFGLANISAHANDEADGPDPSSRVARISFLRGPVYVQTGDDSSWSDATINRPLTSGDQLWTDKQGRSELQMGSTTIQVGANTQLRIAELNDDELQLVVTQGLVNVRVRHLDKDDHVEISTPNAAVIPVERGTYRIEIADRDDVTVVQVRDGAAQVDGAKQDFNLAEGEQLSLRGTTRLTADFDELARADEFDQWSRERNERAERVVATRYVSTDVIGYEDLDDHGSWRNYDDYGYVWVPTRVRSGWAPYRYGHWTWVSPWGWTWIDDAPWGFAPFHYGRWAMLDRRWCWVPGPRTVRAVYAPALVAWVGSPGVSVSINVGRQPVGWIPLGPREVYRPYYRGSHAYVTRVNLSNTRFNNNEFERDYRRQPRDNDYRNHVATSIVQADTLRNAQPVGRHLVRADRTQLQPLTSQPVARPDNNQLNQRGPRLTPPLLPNTRPVLSGRDVRNRDGANSATREPATRNEPRPNISNTTTPDSSRANDNNRWRGRDARDVTVDRGGVESRGNRDSNDVRAPDPRIPRSERFNRNPGGTEATPDTTQTRPRAETAPLPAQRPAADPAILQPSIPPAPRVREDNRAREQARPNRIEPQQPSMRPDNGAMERQRNMRIPNDPAPSRDASPSSSPRMPGNAGDRPMRSGGDGSRGGGRDAR